MRAFRRPDAPSARAPTAVRAAAPVAAVLVIAAFTWRWLPRLRDPAVWGEDGLGIPPDVLHDGASTILEPLNAYPVVVPRSPTVPADPEVFAARIDAFRRASLLLPVVEPWGETRQGRIGRAARVALASLSSPGATVVGSCVGSDDDTGPWRVALARGERLRHRSGKGARRQRVEAAGATDRFVAEMPPAPQWAVLEFSSARRPDRFELRFVDDGRGPGE